MSKTTRPSVVLRSLGISLAILNGILWLSVPTLCAFVDGITGRRLNPDNPRIIGGLQELLVYFDPWLAFTFFPLIYTLGFALIPFLIKPAVHMAAIVVSAVLLALEGAWLTLIGMQVLFRGPNWNMYWPGERWDENKLVYLNQTDFSEYFWYRAGHSLEAMPWVQRELPGMVLLGSYLLIGVLLSYGYSRLCRQSGTAWRSVFLVLLFQLAALVPLKMATLWLLNAHYWIVGPERIWNV
jgi:hypothetical protein